VVACTIDSCNEATDSCIHAPDDALCSNGQFCDGNEICDPLGCLPGTPVSCDDSDACTADTCDDTIDQCVYSDVCCGNGVLDPGEECEPPNDEDCNNGVDDDGDGREDCRDVDSCADPQNPTVGIETCGDDCTLDMPCTRIRRDPAIIKFGLDGRPDRLTIHGRFPLSSTVEPFAEHFSYSLANDEGVIYRGVLIPGDLRGSAKRLKFKDRTARHGVGSRDGLSIVRLKLLTVGGEPYLSFLVKAYGDLSAATLPLMASQIVVGNDSGYLERAWSPTKSGWKLNDRDF
jgi:hypothetical protein